MLITLKVYRYFVDILDSIPTYKCVNLAIVLSPWAHFTQWTRDSLKQRLLSLRDAVRKLKARCPKVPIIVKGSHLREHNDDASRYGWSDYLLLQIRLMMKEIFKAESGVWFLDVWDMNLSYPSEKTVHMPVVVIVEELKLALGYLCSLRTQGQF